MKKIGFFLLMWLGLSCAVQAQVGGAFHFEEGTFSDVLQKAGQEGKRVFVFFHSQWCDGCRLMEKNVLPDPNVVSFYNKNFISISVDAREGTGKELAKKYNIVSFPAMVFFNSNGKIEHKVVSYRPATEFIQIAKTVLDACMTLSALEKRFEAGEREMSFLKNYLKVLRDANDSRLEDVERLYVQTSGLKERFENGERDSTFMEEYAKILDVIQGDDYSREFIPVYLNSLSINGLVTERNWKWLTRYWNLSKSTCYVIENPGYFEKIAGGRENVDTYIESVLQNQLAVFCQALFKEPFKIDTMACDSLINYLKQVRSRCVPSCLIRLELLKCLNCSDYKGLLNGLKKVEEDQVFKIFAPRSDGIYFLERLRGCDDSGILAESITWMTPLVEKIADKETKDKFIVLINDLLNKIK